MLGYGDEQEIEEVALGGGSLAARAAAGGNNL